MRKTRTAILAAIVALGMSAGSISAVWATPVRTTHPSYALGHAKHCRTGYVKKTERHKIHGKEKRYVACVYVAPLTATVALPKPDDPPTVVTVTSNDNPATAGDTVTYTITVASTTIPNTSAQIEVTDNGQDVSGCFPIPNPTYNANGTFSGTCSEAYQSAGTDTVDGIFTGDQTYAQSAGTLTETINWPAQASSPAPPTSSSPAPPTTTPPPPIVLSTTTTENVVKDSCIATTAIFPPNPIPHNVDKCTYTVTATVTNSQGVTLTDNISFDQCSPSSGQTSCSFIEYGIDNGDASPSCPGITATVTASFGGDATDSASNSSATQVPADSLCNP